MPTKMSGLIQSTIQIMRNRKLLTALGVALALGATTAHAQSLDLTWHPSNTPPAAPLPAKSLATATALPPATTPPPATTAAPATIPAPEANPASVWSDPAMQAASSDLQSVAHWIHDSNDNAGLPYLLIDKVGARVFVFNRDGSLRGVAPALLGMSKGDVMTVSNATQMAQMGPDDRITPAGRYLSRLAMDSHGKELLVIDYDAAISLHAVVKGTPKEHRAERLGSPTPLDNRISFGCINVPTDFYSGIVSPTFTGTMGVVYILPETKPANQLFAMPTPDKVAGGDVPTAASATLSTDPSSVQAHATQ